MRKVIYYLVCCAIGSVWFNALASDGQVRLIADVVKPGCVSFDSTSLTVPLGDISALELNKIGATSNWVQVKLDFTDCIRGTPIWLTLEGNEVASKIFALNKDVDSVKGVGLQINRYTSTGDSSALSPNRRERLHFAYNNRAYLYAYYKTYSLPVTSGKANATVQFSLTYE